MAAGAWDTHVLEQSTVVSGCHTALWTIQSLRDEFVFYIFSLPTRRKGNIHSQFRALTQIVLISTAKIKSRTRERDARTRGFSLDPLNEGTGSHQPGIG